MLTRSVVFPLDSCPGLPWPEFTTRLHGAWRESTDLANWAARELLRADVRRDPGMKRLPPADLPDLYNLGFTRGGPRLYPGAERWKGAAGNATSILQRVRKEYLRYRMDVLWNGTRQPSHFGYPFPWLVRADCWGSDGLEGGWPALRVALPGGKVRLRLRGGHTMRRQLAQWAQIVSGEAKAGELSIFRRRASSGCHMRTTTGRVAGGGQRVTYRVMVAVTARFPAAPPREDGPTLLIRTDPEAFLVCTLDGRVERPFLLNADHLLRAIAAHRVYRQRMSEDLKHEKRWPARLRLQMQEALARKCHRFNLKMDGWTREACASVAGFVRRLGVAHAVYDDSPGSFTTAYRWDRLRTLLAQRLEQEGIELQHRPAGGAVLDETPDPARTAEAEAGEGAQATAEPSARRPRPKTPGFSRNASLAPAPT